MRLTWWNRTGWRRAGRKRGRRSAPRLLLAKAGEAAMGANLIVAVAGAGRQPKRRAAPRPKANAKHSSGGASRHLLPAMRGEGVRGRDFKPRF
jgi:hypothetical protein